MPDGASTFLVKPSGDQIVDFYGALAAAVDTEVMVQDAPGVTDVTISPETLVTLSKIDQITSVKVEAPPTALKAGAVVDTIADETFAVFGGQNAQFCLEEMRHGAVGTMPACEFPDLLRPVIQDWLSGRRTEARRAFATLLPLITFGLQPGIAWAVHKEALVARGLIAHPAVRPPARPLDPTARQSLTEIMALLEITPRPRAV